MIIREPGSATLPDPDPRTVRRTERDLRRAGYSPGKVDGKYTARTRAALQELQGALGLTPDGEINAATTRALSAVVKRIQQHDEYIGVGQKGRRVERAERRLEKLGYDVGAKDGIYDQRLTEAVRQFKADQHQLPDTPGRALGTLGQRTLAHEAHALEHAPERRRREPSKERRRLDALTEREASRLRPDGQVGIGRGDRGRAVKNVQGRLRAAGYDPQHTDGRFDQRTEGALRAFQRRSGLPDTGRVDSRTWDRLRRSVISSRHDADPAQRVGERSAAVLRSERMLKKLGLHPGKVDGLFSEQTRRASRAFERRHHGNGTDGAIGEGQLKAMKKEIRRRALDLGPAHWANGYVNGVRHKIKVVQVDGKPVELHTARAFKRMEAAAKKDGISLNVVSGFRTMAEQRYLYNLWLSGQGNPANPPGYSNHQSGKALDLNTTGPSDSVGSGPVYNWLARNAARFGFHRIASEHWHWEYGG